MFKLIDSFPEGYKPNKQQVHVLKELDKAINKKYKFIIINAPTGTGKSFLAKTISNHSNEPTRNFVEACYNYDIYGDGKSEMLDDDDLLPFGTAILTVTKTLQDQYVSMFNDGEMLKGKSNYSCAINDMLTCENGNCVFVKNQLKKCLRGDKCDYFNQRNKAVTNKCSFYNYAMFESLPANVKHKEFIICDEASEIEYELVNRYTVEIKLRDLKKISETLPVSPTSNATKYEIFDWVEAVATECNYAHTSLLNHINKLLKEKSKKKSLTKEESTKLAIITKYKEAFNKLVENWNLTDYIVVHTADGLLFQPYNVDNLAKKIFDFGETVILMSATIVNHKKFAETLGIKDYYFIEAESTFDSKKAPIKCTSKFRLNYKNKNEILPQMCKIAKNICTTFKNKKGIIHTHSMDVLNFLKKELGNDKRFLFREQGINNERILQLHQETKAPTVLVSPSMTHGVDLKGELGEFQIVMKAPFLPLNDERVKRKFEKDKEWYTDAMLSTLIQMCGRCNRSEADYSETFVLDGMILDSIRRNSDKLPKYFIDRII